MFLFFQFVFEFFKYFISHSTGKYCSSITLYKTCFIFIHFPISLMHFCGWPFHYVTWRQMKRYIPHSLMFVPIIHLIQCTIHRRKINRKKVQIKQTKKTWLPFKRYGMDCNCQEWRWCRWWWCSSQRNDFKKNTHNNVFRDSRERYRIRNN